jgi:aspartate kinase
MSKNLQQTIVQKYGGATLATPEKIKSVASGIAALAKAGNRIVVAVSAMGSSTNQLIELAHKVSNSPNRRELDMLLSTGERTSMALMSMALHDLGCEAISFTGSQAGILTTDSHFNARIVDVKAFRVDQALAAGKIVVLAGFQGVCPETKEITTLGRGGTDTTAVAMAAYLHANRCEILKDVDGVMSADPKIVPEAKTIPVLNFEQMLEMSLWGAKVIHHRAIQQAISKNVDLYVGPVENFKMSKAAGTQISAEDEFSAPTDPEPFGAIAINSNEFLVLPDSSRSWTNPNKEIEQILESKDPGINIISDNSKVSSVSVTWNQKTNSKDVQAELLKKILKIAEDAGIKRINSFSTLYSSHVLVPSEVRAPLIQKLFKNLIN